MPDDLNLRGFLQLPLSWNLAPLLLTYEPSRVLKSAHVLVGLSFLPPPCQTRSCRSIETMAVLATPEHLLTDQPRGGCSAHVVVMGVVRLKRCFIGRWWWSFTSGLEWKLSLATDSHTEGSVIISLPEAQRLRLTLQLAKSVGSLRSSEDELMGSGCVAPRSLLACLPH